MAKKPAAGPESATTSTPARETTVTLPIEGELCAVRREKVGLARFRLTKIQVIPELRTVECSYDFGRVIEGRFHTDKDHRNQTTTITERGYFELKSSGYTPAAVLAWLKAAGSL